MKTQPGSNQPPRKENSTLTLQTKKTMMAMRMMLRKTVTRRVVTTTAMVIVTMTMRLTQTKTWTWRRSLRSLRSSRRRC